MNDRQQGCSVLEDARIIKHILEVETVVEKLHAHIFNIILAQNVERKTSQFGKDVCIDANARAIFQ